MHEQLHELLTALTGVRQDPRYHPEGDALFHSLQAFDLARRASSDRALWAAALLHDVGKAVSSPDHDLLGAELLDGIVAPRIVWLVRHHLDLLRAPAAMKRRLRRSAALGDLQRLRAWDVDIDLEDEEPCIPEPGEEDDPEQAYEPLVGFEADS